MAGHQLIDAYLDHLALEMGWRRDRDEIVAEVGDHLHTAVEHRVADGSTEVAAQHDALRQFGDPDLVAKAFATTNQGGVAVPTQFTKLAGSLAIGAAALWIIGNVLFVVSDRVEASTGDWEGAAMAVGSFGALGVLLAAALTCVVGFGLLQRHGGLGWVGAIAMIIAALGAVASLLYWFLFGWGLLIAVASLLLAGSMRRVDIAPRGPTLAFGTGWAIGLMSWVVLRTAEVGPVDSYGDYDIPDLGAGLIGASIFAVGLIGLGRWMRSEQPADAGREPLAAA